MALLGNTPNVQSFTPAIDYFSGNGSTTSFTLSKVVGSSAQVQAVISNVPQNPGSAFTVNGNTITFTSAPPTGTNNIYVYYVTLNSQVVAPSQGSVQSSSMAAGGPTWDKNGNLSVPGTVVSGSSLAFRNRIINGAMMIDQRNAGASVTPSVDGTYTLDRWSTAFSIASKFSVQQNAGAVTPPVGFRNYLGVTSASAYSVGANDYFFLYHRIEGHNVYDLAWGTANAASVTLSFWVRSSLTGTFGGFLRSSDYGYSYPFSYTISAANTWEYKTITVAGPTSGTWYSDNRQGLELSFSLGCGSTYSGTPGAWVSGNKIGATGATSIVGTNGATFYITGVQLEKGTAATSFEYRDYGRERQMCQRYYYQLSQPAYYRYGLSYNDQTTTNHFVVTTPAIMRAIPTVGYNSIYNPVQQLTSPTASLTGNIMDIVSVTSGASVGLAPLYSSVSSSMTFSSEL